MATETANNLKTYRKLAWLSAMVVSLGASGWAGLIYFRECARFEHERKRAEWREKWFNDARSGQRYATIMDPGLIPMLANDPDCIRNLSELHFSMVQINPTETAGIERLSNVRHLIFYDTLGVDAVLLAAEKLPIETMAFDMARPSEDRLRALSEFPSLRRIHFGHIVYPREIAILEKLNPDIEIDAIHRAGEDPKR